MLAAGKSTRIASVAGGRPKPLLEVQRETVLSRNLRWLSTQGIKRVWINLHYRPDEIQAAIGDGARFGLTVQYVYEPDILGTAGAVRNLSSEWDKTLLVVYGDSLLSFDLHGFFEFHRARQACLSIALFDRERHRHTGIAGGQVKLAADGQLEAFCEGEAGQTPPLVNAGVYLIEPEVVATIPTSQVCDFGRDLFPRMLSDGQRLYGYLITGYCLGIDTPESYEQAMRLIKSGEVVLS